MVEYNDPYPSTIASDCRGAHTGVLVGSDGAEIAFATEGTFLLRNVEISNICPGGPTPPVTTVGWGELFAWFGGPSPKTLHASATFIKVGASLTLILQNAHVHDGIVSVHAGGEGEGYGGGQGTMVNITQSNCWEPLSQLGYQVTSSYATTTL
jgi:hypothetical protein